MNHKQLREIIDQKISEGYEVDSLVDGCVRMHRGTNKIEIAPVRDNYIIRRV